MRVPADAYARLTSYASAGSALLLHSDFKSFNEPYNICGLSVTPKPTYCTAKLVFKQQHFACRRMHTLIRPRMHLPVPLSLLAKKTVTVKLCV
jgi:hypothetical protein